jgi:outer membrane immunogenic protein
MHRLSIAVLAAVSTIAFTQFASAADLPRKAPAYTPPPPAWNWTGFYIGVNAGGSIGRDPSTINGAVGATALVPASFTLSPAGFIGGGQIGYNYHFATHWVVGVEGDFQGATQKDSACFGNCSGNAAITSFTFLESQKVKWFATARARLGYTGSPWLWYVTGGAAWGEVHNDFVVVNLSTPGSANYNKSGWTVGAGVETHLGGNWTAKLEYLYLYLDLGSITDTTVSTLPTITWTIHSDIRDHIVRGRTQP